MPRVNLNVDVKMAGMGQSVPGGDTWEPASQPRCLDPKFSPLHGKFNPSRPRGQEEAAFRLRNRVEVSDPALCRAKPKLPFRDELVALARGAHADSVDFRPFPNSAGIDRCPAFRAEGLWPFGPAFTRLNICLQFAREK